MSVDPQDAAAQAAQALIELARVRPELAQTLARVTAEVAAEAVRSQRFADALSRAVAAQPVPASRRTGRRAPGVLDPFEIFATSGEAALRERLAELDLEQLRDVVAEHGMDHDRLAMRWKDPGRVIDRIVEKVEARSKKGSAFRG